MNSAAILIPIIAVAGFFTAVIVWVYMHYNSRHQERMALIESGKDAKIFDRPKRENKNALKLGIVGVMSGIGLFFGSILDRFGMESEVAYFSMILLFGGIGLVGFYWLVNHKEESKDSDML
ncbi:MAG: DUF6249 domain-containing protein [Saprospiraceae bacterium]|nr:DUF6249 domain-containing protein [Saprospiraceae bacterium]